MESNSQVLEVNPFLLYGHTFFFFWTSNVTDRENYGQCLYPQKGTFFMLPRVIIKFI